MWVFAAVGALGVLLPVLILFRAPDGLGLATAKPVQAPATAVKLVSLGKNEASLTDPTPLFLPTEWNAGQNALPAYARREPGSSFQGYPPNLKFAETELKLNLPAPITLPAQPSDALALDRPGATFIGLGFSDQTVAQLSPRKAFVEVLAAGNGQRVLAQSLPDASPPGGLTWRPMEFLVAVDAMGLVGPPILTESSQVAEVDGYFQNYLVKTLHTGERLAPGFYRICVGP